MRILFALIFFLLTFANWVKARFAKHPYFDSPTLWENEKGEEEIDYLLGWASWSRWSHCSKSCGNGIQYQLRRCLDVRCSGISNRHRICNTEVCPIGSRSSAEIECGLRFKKSILTLPHTKNNSLNSNNMKWHEGNLQNHNCSLICQSEEAAEDGSIKRFETSLPDGSQCKLQDEISGICFRGKCENLGCDLIIGSTQKLDQCGICGGNGQSCGKAVFKWRDTHQFSPCDKSCGSNRYQVSVSVCMNTITNRVVPERLCADQKRPRPQVKECPYIVCPSNCRWLTSDWSTCSTTCGNSGIKTRSIFCVETNNPGNFSSASLIPAEKIENRKVDDQYCWELARPTTTESCPMNECPEWAITGNWGECKCDDEKIYGWQKRLIECQQGDNKAVNEILCKSLQRPTNIQKCICNNNNNEIHSSNNNDESTQNLDRYRFVAESPFSQWNDDARSSYSLQEEPARLLHGFAGGTDKTKPKFYPGVFSECSTTCGPGVRTRTVECIAFQGLTSNVIKLPDYECEGDQKPPLFQPCQIQQCPDGENDVRAGATLPGTRGNYRWDYGDWSPCSASCLGGRQKSSLKCIDMNRKISVPWSHCDAKQRPVDLWRDCNKEPCPASWEVGVLGECSHTCGGGIRTRRVRCVRHMAKAGEAESTLILPDAQCPSPKPFHQEPCGLEDCGPAWRVEQWSPCSASCGPGEQRRSVICEQRTAGGLLRIFNPPNECMERERPPTVQLCNLGSCDPTSNSLYSYDVVPPPSSAPLIRQYSDESISSNRIENNLNFEQNNQNHRKLTLNVGGIANLYEGTSIKVKCPVRGFDRTKIIWTKDGQKLQNNAHLKVSSNGALRIFHARMEDAGLYACFANGARGNVTLHFKHRENEQLSENDINRTKPKHLPDSNTVDMLEPDENEVDSDLTPNDVDQELLKKVRQSLESLGEYRFIQKLETLKEPGKLKVDYQSGDWSPCSQQECGKPDGAQVRLIKCRVALDDGAMAYVEDKICEAYGINRPPASVACHNPDCPEWEANDWTDCSASRCIREQTSIQRREVKCVFLNGTVADFGLCSRKDRPKIKKECLNPNCTAIWKPSIWGKCSKSCGDGGVQMRLLRCVWKGTRKAAGVNCDPSTRPSAIRSCADSYKLPPCKPGEEFSKQRQQQSNNIDMPSYLSSSSLLSSSSSLEKSLYQNDEPIPVLPQIPKNWRGWNLYDFDWRKLGENRKFRRV